MILIWSQRHHPVCPATHKSHVFPEPEQIMTNLIMLNQHIAQKISATVKLQIPGILKTLDNSTIYQDEHGDCWRALRFIVIPKV